MADNSVFVSGVASGAFKEAMEGLPPWATEETSKRIENYLKRSLDVQTKAFSQLVKSMQSKDKGKSGSAQDLDSELSRALAGVRRSREEEEKQRKEKKKWFEEDKKTSSSSTQVFSTVSALMVTFGNNIRQTMIDNVNAYDQLIAAGVQVVDGFNGARSGFESLQQMATITGVRFTELSKTIVKFSGAVNAYGIEKFSKTFSAATPALRYFGFSAKESAELLGSYLESQRGYTDMRNKSEAEVQAGLVDFGKRISRLSLATGMARQTILDNMQAISHSTEATILNGQAGEYATEKTLAFIASFKDQNLGRAFLRMMTDAISPLNDTFMSFQKIGFGGFGNELVEFMKSLEGMNPEDAQKAMAEFEQRNGAQMNAMIKQANLLRQTGLKAEADDVLSKLSAIKQQSRLYNQVDEKERKKLEESNRASKQFADSMEKFRAQLQITFAPTTKILDLLTYGLESVNNIFQMLRDAAAKLETTLTDFIGGLGFKLEDKLDLVNWAGFGLAIVSVVGGFKLLNSVLQASVSKLGGLFGGGSRGGGAAGGAGRAAGAAGAAPKGGGFISKMAAGLERLGSPKALLGVATLAGLAGTLFITGKAVKEFTEVSWDALGKAAATLTGLLVASAALGKASPMMLLGAAGLAVLGGALYITGSALEKFVNIGWEDLGKSAAALVGLGVAGAAAGAVAPAILVGAVAFGAMGVALGVIGGAAALAAPGLESLGKSLTSFQQINGDNLIKIATGIGALSVAMVAFSASSAVGSIGSIFSGMASGLSKLFGGDGSPLEQVAKMASLGAGLEKTVSSLSMLSGSISSLSSSLGALTGIDKITSIVSAVNNLSLLKAAAFSMISPVASVMPPRSQTKGNTLLEKTSGSVPATGASGPNIEKQGAGPDINSTLEVQRQLIEQLVRGTNDLVSVNKDILKYTKMRA